MKSIIASLFAIYSITSGSNRLLQQFPIVLPPAAAGGGPKTSHECVEPYQIEDPSGARDANGNPVMIPNPNTCAGKPLTIDSPAQMFELKCSALGGCAMAEIHLNYPQGATKNLNLIEFSEAYAGYKAKIFVNSQQTRVTLKVNEISCTTAGACNDMEIWLDNADLGDMTCPYPSYCANCKIFVVGQVDAKTGAPLFTPCFGY